MAEPLKKKITYMDPETLIPYEFNPRTHKEEIRFLENSMRDFGFPPSKAIEVDKDMVIICGHGRRIAAMNLGINPVPVCIRDDLTEGQIKAYRLADNKISDLSGNDWENVAHELKAIEALPDIDGLPEIDMSDYGFDPYIDAEEPEPGNVGSIVDEEEVYEDKSGTVIDSYCDGDVPEECDAEPHTDIDITVKRGDVYRLGRHYLMCGDSTSVNDISTLMNGVKADICFSSPPYNAKNPATGRAENGSKYLNDNDERDDDEYFDLLNDALTIALANSHEVFFNIGLLSGSKRAIIDLLHAHKNEFKDMIYWKKNNPPPAAAHNIISSAVELIMAFGHNPSRSFRHDPGIFYGVIEGNINGQNEFSAYHRAVFPQYLPDAMIETFTSPEDVVLDVFGGCGTTMMSCESLGRTCYSMDIEPMYVQLAIERWEKATGGHAEKVL